MSVSDKERKDAERKRKHEEGLVRFEVWTWPEHRPKVKQYVKRLNKRSARLNGAEQ